MTRSSSVVAGDAEVGAARRARRRTAVVTVAVAVLLAVALAAAWYLESRAPESGYRLRITRGGRLLASYTAEEIEAMPAKSVVLQGNVQTGPSLRTVLEDAGAGEFASVTVIGANTLTGKPARLVLRASRIGPDTVLDVAAKRRTVKIAAPYIPRNDRVRDISEIAVR